MRNADKQSIRVGGEKWYKHFKPVFEGHITKATSSRFQSNWQIQVVNHVRRAG